MYKYENNQKFLLVWDMYGIEAIIDLSLKIQEEVEHILSNKPGECSNFFSIIQFWMLRARFNPHRNYEIYAVTVPDGVTREDLANWFNESPQSLADLIRNKGVQLYGLKNSLMPVIR